MVDDHPDNSGATRQEADSGLERIDFPKVREAWQKGLKTKEFEQKASLEIAKWVLVFFGGVLCFCFYIGAKALSIEGGLTYDNVIDLIKTLLGSILPLATLAVGYYLGEKSR